MDERWIVEEREEVVRSARRRRCRWGILPGRRSSGVCNQRRATGPCTRWASAPPTEGTAAAVTIPTTSCGPGGTAPGRPSCTPKKRRGPKEKTICEPRISDLKKWYAYRNKTNVFEPIPGFPKAMLVVSGQALANKILLVRSGRKAAAELIQVQRLAHVDEVRPSKIKKRYWSEPLPTYCSIQPSHEVKSEIIDREENQIRRRRIAKQTEGTKYPPCGYQPNG